MPSVAAKTMEAEALVSDHSGDVHLLVNTVARTLPSPPANESNDTDTEEEGAEVEGLTQLHLGPEPELVMSKMQGDGDDSHYVPKNLGEVPISTIPDRYKFKISLMIWALLLCTFGIAFYAVKKEGLFCPAQPDPAVSTRLGVMQSMLNTSASPCDSFYNYACGSYNAMYTESSTFSQTQLLLVNSVEARSDVFAQIVNRTAEAADVTEETLQAIGVFGCFELEVSLDFKRHVNATGDASLALYLAVACPDCAPTRDNGGTPQRLSGIPDAVQAYPEAERMMHIAFNNYVPVYFIPPNNSVTDVDTVFASECSENSTARNTWNETLESGPFSIATEFYSTAVDAVVYPQPMEAALNASVQHVIKSVKENMIEYLRSAQWAAAQLDALVARVMQIKVHFGEGRPLIPTCNPSTSLVACVNSRWEAQKELLQQRSVSVKPGCIPDFEVNAVYCPFLDAVYIPRALAAQPFFSPNWTDTMKMATLGYVVAHEMSHSLSAQLVMLLGSNITLDAGMRRFQECVAGNLERSGSERVERTLQEAFADTVALDTVSRVFRRDNTHQSLQLGYTMYAQNFCNSGTPKTLPAKLGPYDSHPTPFLRVDTTIRAQLQMQSAYACPPSYNAHYVCQ